MTTAIRVLIATAAVEARGLRNRLLRRGDLSGLTVPCAGNCGDDSPHTGHLAAGALTYLGRHGQRAGTE